MQHFVTMVHMIEKLKAFDFWHKAILVSILSMFCTQYVQCVVMFGFVAYALYTKKLMRDIRSIPGYKWLFGFWLLEICVALFYGNLVGMFNAIGMLVLFAFMSLYRSISNVDLLNFCIDCILVLSMIVGVLALLEFAWISHENGVSFFDFHIFNSPKRRIHVTFENANLYAMMLEFFVFFCVARFAYDKNIKRRAFYIFCALFNFGLLFLTGCRTALLPFVVVIPLFLWIVKEKGWFALSLVVVLLGSVFVAMDPDLIPRITDLSTLESRYKIWSCALLGIQDHLLFGMGCQSYGLYYQIYNGHKAPHCHNIYLDCIASYGIVGTLVLLVYLLGYVRKDLWQAYQNDRYLFGLMLGMALIVVIHGVLDVTINVLGCMMCLVLVFYTQPKKSVEKEINLC